jgi:hypothetical protein
MTTMVWINVLLAVPFIALWAGIPLWLVLRRPDTRPQLAGPVGYASRRRMMANVPAISAAASRR